MASFHCAVKSGGGGRGATHSAYIEREGKYKTADKDDLEHVQTLNLPEWAANSAEFWRESDLLERANSNGYREYEIALPREMTPAQRLDFVHEFIATEIGDKNVCTFAIHCPLAALEGGEQPHAHIMFSERTHDGIERKTPEHYFKRANSKEPERGGCKKSNGVPKTPAERKAELVAFRERFAVLQNKHLEKNGHADRVTHLSLAARGLEGPQVGHYGPLKTRIVASINKATVLIERGFNQEVSEFREIVEKERGDDRIREKTLGALGKSSEATDRACAFTVSDDRGTADNLRAASRDLAGAKEGAKRRVAERHYGRAVGATQLQFKRVGELIQQVADRFPNVVSSIADAARQVARQITTRLKREGQQAEQEAQHKAQEAAAAAAKPNPWGRVRESLEAVPRPAAEAANAAAAKLLEVAQQVELQWNGLLKAERQVYLGEMTAQARQKLIASVAEHQAHVDAKPLIFGRDKWEARCNQFETRDDKNRLAYEQLKTGDYPFVERDKETVLKAVEERVSAANPDLAKAMPKAQQVLQIERVRLSEERYALAVADRTREREARATRSAGRGRNDGPSR